MESTWSSRGSDSRRRYGEPQEHRRAKVATKLAATGYAALRNIRCEARDDVLILSGVVPSYYMKQVAQTVSGKVDGINQIDNRLEVRSPR